MSKEMSSFADGQPTFCSRFCASVCSSHSFLFGGSLEREEHVSFCSRLLTGLSVSKEMSSFAVCLFTLHNILFSFLCLCLLLSQFPFWGEFGEGRTRVCVSIYSSQIGWWGRGGAENSFGYPVVRWARCPT